MNVSPNELRKETLATLKIVNEQIARLEDHPIDPGMSIFQVLRDSDRVAYATLLAARLTALNTLALLNAPRLEHRGR